jgi:hypothetical protein
MWRLNEACRVMVRKPRRLRLQVKYVYVPNILSDWRKFLIYEGEAVYRSQMDIKRRTYDIRTWEKHLFLDISSANIGTLVPSLYQCVETRGIAIFWLLSPPLPHLVGLHLWLSNVLERISRTSCEPLYATNTTHRKQETFLYEYPLHRVILPTKNAQQNAALR